MKWWSRLASHIKLYSVKSSAHPIRSFHIVCILLDLLQLSVVRDPLLEDDGVLHQGEEDEHHAGQQPDLHCSHSIRHGDPRSEIKTFEGKYIRTNMMLTLQARDEIYNVHSYVLWEKWGWSIIGIKIFISSCLVSDMYPGSHSSHSK